MLGGGVIRLQSDAVAVTKEGMREIFEGNWAMGLGSLLYACLRDLWFHMRKNCSGRSQKRKPKGRHSVERNDTTERIRNPTNQFEMLSAPTKEITYRMERG